MWALDTCKFDWVKGALVSRGRRVEGVVAERGPREQEWDMDGI